METISRRAFAALLASTAAGFAVGFGPAVAQAKAPGGTVVVPLVGGTPSGINPATSTGFATRMPGTQLFASPLRFDAKWNPQPYLAEHWEMAADGLSLTLKLVAGATFHDGKPITSADVAYSVIAVQKYHPFGQMFATVTGVDTPDPLTAVIRLSEPRAALLLSLSPAMCPILPKHIFDDGTDLRTNPANRAPIGSGPFRFVEFTPDQHITLERYDKFFIPNRPILDRIVYPILADEQSAVLGLERGESDLLTNMNSPRDAARLSRDPNLAVTDQGYSAMGALTWLAFNTIKPPLDDRRVRQAICFAADRATIIKNLLQGKAKAATGPIAPSSPFYTDAVEQYAVNIDKANQLLDQAGHPRGPNGMRFKLTIDYPLGVGDVVAATAQYFRPQLRKIGIDVEVRTSPDFATWARHVGSWDFDMTIDSVLNWGDPSIGVDRTYVSSNIRKGVIWSNTQNYRNPEVDKLLKEAAAEIDFKKRKLLYTKFQQIVVDDAPIYYINVTPFETAYNKKVHGMSDSIWGVTADPMDTVYIATT